MPMTNFHKVTIYPILNCIDNRNAKTTCTHFVMVFFLQMRVSESKMKVYSKIWTNLLAQVHNVCTIYACIISSHALLTFIMTFSLFQRDPTSRMRTVVRDLFDAVCSSLDHLSVSIIKQISCGFSNFSDFQIRYGHCHEEALKHFVGECLEIFNHSMSELGKENWCNMEMVIR